MTKKSKVLLISVLIFVFLQVALNIVLACDVIFDYFTSNTSDWIKYSSVIACFLMSTISFKTKKGCLVIAGLAFTLIADYFLLVLDKYYEVGLSAFILAQAMYFLYIMPKHWPISLGIRFGLFGIAALVLPLALDIKQASAFIAAFYFINLFMNTVDAYLTKDKGLLVFAIGLTFFIGCDIFVCLYNIRDYMTITNSFINALIKHSLFASFVCYIPSQTLISISPVFRQKFEIIRLSSSKSRD